MTIHTLDETPSLPKLYAKALLGSLPGGGGDELPDQVLSLPEVRIEREHVAAYARVCGFRLADELPPTYLHVHAFPLALKLMTERSFPLPLLGLVHVSNAIDQVRPLRVSDALALSVRARDLRRSDRGTEVDLVAEAEADGERVWRSTSTYLRRGGGAEPGEAAAGGSSERSGRPPEEASAAPPRADPARSPGDAARPRPDAARLRPDASWRLPGDVGRRYAAVSGDINPIHLHRLTARLFGFPRALAHGMWTKARCLAALEGRLPERMAVEVEFLKPLLLPATVAFASKVEDGGRTLDLRDARSGAPHLVGSVRCG